MKCQLMMCSIISLTLTYKLLVISVLFYINSTQGDRVISSSYGGFSWIPSGYRSTDWKVPLNRSNAFETSSPLEESESVVQKHSDEGGGITDKTYWEIIVAGGRRNVTGVQRSDFSDVNSSPGHLGLQLQIGDEEGHIATSWERIEQDTRRDSQEKEMTKVSDERLVTNRKDDKDETKGTSDMRAHSREKDSNIKGNHQKEQNQTTRNGRGEKENTRSVYDDFFEEEFPELDDAEIKALLDDDESPDASEARRKKKKKFFKKLLLPLLVAYKLKFIAIVPVLIAALVLLAGSTGLAGFFFALFAAAVTHKEN